MLWWLAVVVVEWREAGGGGDVGDDASPGFSEFCETTLTDAGLLPS